VGLPLVPRHGVALLPANIATFAEGLEVDLAEVRLYLAVREAARVRLFAEVAWLGPQLVAAVQAYARDISIDTEGIESALRSIDPSDPEAMQSALSNSLFTPEPSRAQRAALLQLETYLALVEGWVAVIADRATSKHLPHPAALDEAVRRERASAGPAGQIFSQLVGLELHPRRLRDAANLWAALESRGGATVRDSAWAHPDVAPTAADLDDPLGYVDRFMSRATRDEMDTALDALLSEGASGERGDLPHGGGQDQDNQGGSENEGDTGKA
jgi:putative hydrolase